MFPPARPREEMTRGGWQVRERKARQAAKASRISAPITISLSPTATRRSTTGSPDIISITSTTSTPDLVPLALFADYSPSATPDIVAPAAEETTTPARTSTPTGLSSTLTDGSPPDVVAVATAPSISSVPVSPAASIQPSPTVAIPFDAVISEHADDSVLQYPAPGKKLNNRGASKKFAEAAAAAIATLESSPACELSEVSEDSALVQSTSSPPPSAEGFQQATATAEYLGAELRQFFHGFPGGESYESNKEREGQEEQEEEDLETMTAKITSFRQALRTDVKAPWQTEDRLQSRQDQREKELQEAIVQAELRIADFQSHTAQAHEELLSFLTHKLAKQEETSRNDSRAASRMIALLIFCNCASLGLLISPYL